MMGEVECKHVSICCWDGGDHQKEFSPWPSLLEASGCCPRLQGVTKTDTWTQRNRLVRHHGCAIPFARKQIRN